MALSTSYCPKCEGHGGYYKFQEQYGVGNYFVFCDCETGIRVEQDMYDYYNEPPKVRVITSKPVALESADHLDAANSGSGNDNSTNPLFREKLLALFENKSFSLLDIGCAGGGFVKSVHDTRNLAVGLEGSDYCKNLKKFEWATIPENLFTCDVTEPFAVVIGRDVSKDDPEIYNAPRPWQFDVVTAWEVMEHFRESKLLQVSKNVALHLAKGGMWIMSVSEQPDGGKFHKTIRPRSWWLKTFDMLGWVHDQAIVDYFGVDMVRGPFSTPWAIEAPMSFHLALRRKANG